MTTKTSNIVDEIRALTDRNDLQWWVEEGNAGTFKALHADDTVLTLRELKEREGLLSWLAGEPRFKTCGRILAHESEDNSTEHAVDTDFISAVKSQLTRRGVRLLLRLAFDCRSRI